ncbi:MAG: sulfotransferase [Nocardia sp.]|nr:sulfotransferase [Nocardia sp.]
MTARTNVGTVEDLHASATKACGLTDFGPDDYYEALGVLLESYQRDAGLTELGSKMQRYFLRGALVARALSEASWQANPGYADTEISRPIFVTGLPRTGTTALHRLLAADPRHQALEMWLTEMPQPRPPRESWAANPIFQQIEAGFSQHRIENPEFMGLHYMGAAEVEECWQLLRQTVKSVSYETLAYLPTYSRWLREQDWTDAYQRHKKNLQLIGLGDRRRWVLKNPSHMFALDALMRVYPDALIIQTHRDPVTIVASACSLSEEATKGWSTTFVGEKIGSTQMPLWARGLREFNRARARYDPDQFLDIEFDELRADPLGTVDKIYAAFGIEQTDAGRRAMVELDKQSRSGDRKPAHTYSLADYGLTEDQVRAEYAGL